MAFVMNPSSPNSFQLKRGSGSGPFSAFRHSKSLVVFRRTVWPVNLRIRSFSATGSTARDGDGRSWIDSESASPDPFSGWSSTDSGPQRRRLGGIMAAGVSGVILAAGITFASLSLSKRSVSGVKQQMEPLTVQQEVLFTSDDQNEKEDQVGDHSDSEKVSLDPDRQTGTNQDSFLSVDLTEATSESRPDDNALVGTSIPQSVEPEEPNSGLIAPGIDAFNNASSKEDFKMGRDVDEFSEVTDSPEVPDFVSIGDPDASRFEYSSRRMVSGVSDKVTEPIENTDIAYPANISVSETDSLNLSDQEATFVSVEIENSQLPLDFSSDSDKQPLSNPLAWDSSIPLESDVAKDSQVEYKVVMEAVTPVSSEKHSNLSEASQFPSEGISAPLEGHSLNGNGLFETTSTSVLVDFYGNESDTNDHYEIDRSRSLFESPIPENSFSFAGIPAPSTVSAALQVAPGKVVIPAVIDQVQGQALAALQVLKVIEADVQPSDLCTRREYARWLVAASSALSRNSVSKVYPAMYVENVTELAFDDITPNDPDFSSIQGLAEAGLISSKLSRCDMSNSSVGELDGVIFSPESALSRQDLVSWKMALEKRQLPEVNKKILYQRSGFIDIDRVNPDAWPALVADLSAGEQGIIALAFGYTRLFQPDKPVTKAQAAIALATGDAAEVVGEELTRIEAESMADTAVAAHTALVAQVEKDLNSAFEKELAMEREKVDAIEKLAEEARLELERLKAERDEENNSLMRGRAAVESEVEVLSKLRHEVEEQLQSIMSSKMEISFERDRLNKLRKEAENENQTITQLQYELEVERKALSMARAWAEDEARRARDQAKALEEARDRWERHGIKVVVDSELRDEAAAGITWLNAGNKTEQTSPTEETINRAEKLAKKLEGMASEIKIKSSAVVEKIIQKIKIFISNLKQQASVAAEHSGQLYRVAVSAASRSVEGIQRHAAGFSVTVKDATEKLARECRGGMEKITHKFKT